MTTTVKYGISKTEGPVYSLIQTDDAGVVRLVEGAWPPNTKECDKATWEAAADAADVAIGEDFEGYFVKSQGQETAVKSATTKLKALGLTAIEIEAMIGSGMHGNSSVEVGFDAPKIQRPPPS